LLHIYFYNLITHFKAKAELQLLEKLAGRGPYRTFMLTREICAKGFGHIRQNEAGMAKQICAQYTQQIKLILWEVLKQPETIVVLYDASRNEPRE
jgi:hypothetical protein